MRDTTRDEWREAAALGDPAEDRFARTFLYKADFQLLWPVLGAWRGGELLGGAAWTVTRRAPRVANLQLLHSFSRWRGRGVARLLCEEVLKRARGTATHFRVSSEPGAVGFYERIGVRFLGAQKSGCLLSVGRIDGEGGFAGCVYDVEDPVAAAAVGRKGKGGCVVVFQRESPQR